MNGTRKWNMAGALVLGCLVLGACGTDSQFREIDLAFDGNSCDASGPRAVEAGNLIIDLENLTDGLALVDVYKLNAGKTWQDMLEHFGAPGTFELRPDWAHGMSGRSVQGDADAREYILTPGTYGVVCFFMGGGISGIWPATSIEVEP